MNSTVTLTNSSEFYLSNEEVFLRGIPTAINVGSLTTDALRLLIFYVAKSGPYKLAVESGFFTGTLEEWLNSLHGTGEGAGIQGPKGKSAYELYVESVQAPAEALSLVDWLNSLVGAQGAKGDDGADGVTQNATTITFTGLVTDTATPVLDTDTLLIVIGKLQAQITALETRVVALESVNILTLS